MMIDSLRLHLVTNIQERSLHDYKAFILNAVEGGVTLVQLREKNKSLNEIKLIALELKSLLDPLNIPLIINDHVEIAKEVDAHGVHLGQSDLSPLMARKILGESKIIGWSVESMEEAEKANQLSCIDYVGASVVFASQNKSDYKYVWGVEGLRDLVEYSHHPVVAIGGIQHSNVGLIVPFLKRGGIAVVGAIHDAPCPKEAASQLISFF